MYFSNPTDFRSSRLEVFLGKSVLKICSKFIGQRPCRSVNWIYNFRFRYLQILIVSLACSTGHKGCLNNTKEMFNNWKAKNKTWVLNFNGWYVWDISGIHCEKIVRIWSYSGLHFPAFVLNTERCGVFLCIQSECWKIRENTDQNNSEYRYVLRSAYHQFKFFLENFPTSQEKEPSDGVLRKRYSKSMQQFYRRTLILRHECSPVYLSHIFRTIFPESPLEGCLFIRTSLLLGNIQNPIKHQRYSFFQKQLAT